MSSEQPAPSPDSDQPTVIVQTPPARRGGCAIRLLMLLLIASVMFNVSMYSSWQDYFSNTQDPIERFHSGDASADDRIVLLQMSATIIPPYTERLIRAIEQASDDDRVKGAVLVVDSPGGLVADSHQIYHRLKKLSDAKPVFVAMKRIAASGGYYISMGAGPNARIFAEPTTWTGSIGVIIPRYNVKELAERFGVYSEPLATGPYKDSLSPFRDLRDDERVVWDEILQDAYGRFIDVIDENRTNLDRDEVVATATGRIFTANQALEVGLVDEVGYVEDAINALQEQIGLTSARVVTYDSIPGLIDIMLGSKAEPPDNPLETLLDASVPRAMYMFSWDPSIPRAD